MTSGHDQDAIDIGTDLGIDLVGTASVLWRYRGGGGLRVELAPPVFEVDGQPVLATATLAVVEQPAPSGPLAPDVRELTCEGPVAGEPDLTLRLVIRTAADDPVVRFRYLLSSATERRLTKVTGADAVRLAGVVVPGRRATEIRLSDYSSLVHSYVPTEVDLGEAELDAGLRVMGPLLSWPLASLDPLDPLDPLDETGHAVLGYEHGSQHPDLYLGFDLSPERVELVAVKGTYLTGHDLRAPYATVWVQVAAVPGPRSRLASAYRSFVLRHLAPSAASRTPAIFYNTWNHQERVHHWTGRPYLAEMNADRMLAEIEVAHRIGVEVFVIDTGWYDRTGDWRVDPDRFPAGLTPIHDRLRELGMRLGLWFGPTSAARSSTMLERNTHNVMSWHGERAPAREVWETEASEELCLVSSYAEDFAAELVRCARELGVTYFKWDAVGQYGCDDPHHDHGTVAHTARERAESYAYQQPLALARIVEQVSAAVPEAIVDFDVTEPNRCVGLAFLAAGKYFLINNGPYLPGFDVPTDKDLHWSNDNLFFYPGAARDWVCRTPLTYDTWLPSVLFLTHYLPDDPASNQDLTVGSLVLGQNGIWGDLLAISEGGVERLAAPLRAYKQVRAAITDATLRRTGVPGGAIESYEKIDPATGRGVVVVFANQVSGPYGTEQPLVIELSTAAVVDRAVVATENARVVVAEHGRARITASFTEVGAAIIFFGAVASNASPSS